MLYGAGAAMGFTPQDVDATSMWQFQAALNGFIAANSKSEPSKLSDDEADELFAWIDAGHGAEILTTQTYRWEGVWPEPAGIVAFTVTD